MEATGETFETNAAKDLIVTRDLIQGTAGMFLGEGGNLQDRLPTRCMLIFNGFPPIYIQLRLCRGSISLFADVTLAVIKKILSCTSKKLNEQPADFLWLLLFNPVSGSVNKMDAAHLRTGGALHPLKRTGHLENAPVALAGNEE